jgi:type I restriction enzyme S subunit
MAHLVKPGTPLPDGWRWAKLGDVCDQERVGIAADNPKYPALPYIGLEHIEPETGRVLVSQEESPRSISKSSNFVFTSEHVLYGKLRPYLNKVALPDFAGRCSTEIVPLRPLEADRAWLAWMLRHEDTVEYAMRGKTGSRMPRASMPALLKMPVAIPPRAAQRRIATQVEERLSVVERAKQAAEAALVALEQLPTLLVDSLFDSGSLSEGWRTTPLGELCKLVRGVTFEKDQASSVPQVGHLPILRAGNIGYSLDTESDLLWVPEELVSAEQRLRQGDIAICMSSGSQSVVGKTAALKSQWEGSVGAFCGIIRGKDRSTSQFVSLWLQSSQFRRWRDAQARGASIQNLRSSQLAKVEIPLPPAGDQQSVSMALERQQAAADRARQTALGRLADATALMAAVLRSSLAPPRAS